MSKNDLTDFNRVDETGTPERFVRFLDTAFGIEGVKAVKSRMFELLDAKPGDQILEVGCGTGDDARALAELVSPGGNVVAIDTSEEMISEAKSRGQAPNASLTFTLGDVTALDLASGIFDACRIDRTLIHVPDPARAVQEMVRVLRGGGRLVAFEPELETLVVDSTHREVTRKILTWWCDGFQSGWVARHLPALFKDCGLLDVYVEPRTAIFDFDFANQLFVSGTLERATESGVVTSEQAETWLSDLERARDAGSFFCANMGFIVSGRKAEG